MKSIEEIEKLDLEQLEAISEMTGIEVPGNIGELTENALTACRIVGEDKTVKVRRMTMASVFSATAVAAAIALIFTVGRPQLTDTYSDPRMAYAEVERTFELIQQKTSKGLNMALDNRPIDKINGMMNKINNGQK